MKSGCIPALLLPAVLWAQSPPAPQADPVAQAEDTVLRISVTLVQVDAVVTDSKGKQVTDLKASDFEVLQDGKPQKITHFSYISNIAPAGAKPAGPVTPRDKNAPPPPPSRLRPDQVHRTIALVVDDLGLAFDSMAFVRQALKKFVDEQMQPNDLVAVVRTGAGAGAFQQFTSDKRLLYAAIDRVKWNALGRGGMSAFAPMSDTEDPGAARADELRGEYFSVGTLGAINYIVRGLKDLPGRKSIILFSDNLNIFNSDGQSERVLDNLRQLTDLANRSSVVIYTMDARGLPTLGFTAEDRPDTRNPRALAEQMSKRSTGYFRSQDGLNYLAVETGGLFLHDSNDLNGGIRKVLEDQAGYYLIGYQPDESTFKTGPRGERKYHKVKVRLKVPGLQVRSRSGFFGNPEGESKPPVYHGRDAQLAGALASPFVANAIPLRLTSFCAFDDKTGPYLYSMLHIDAKELSLTDEADGMKKAVVDILLLTYGNNGQVVDQSNKTFTIRMKDEAYKSAIEYGLVYSLNYVVKKPGAYQMRAAVRDAKSEKVGTATQFTEVPDVKKGRLTISGVIIRKNPKPADAAPAPAETQTGEDPAGTPALRIFRQGSSVLYAYQVMNAQVDNATKMPRLETQLKVFRNGQMLYFGKLQEAPAGEPRTDWKSILLGGRFQLSAQTPPGEYVLQVIATDQLAKNKKYKTASQWIDFEVVK